MVETSAVISVHPPDNSRARYVIAGLGCLLCVLAYGLVLNGPLFFDDLPNIIDNELLKISGVSFDDWRVAVFSSDAGLAYRPVSMFTFALNHVVAGGFSAAVLKGTNLGIHLAIGGLVFLFFSQLLRTPALDKSSLHPQRQFIATFAALLWLVHPIHVSTVLYAVQRMAQLSMFFSVAGLVVFMRYRLRWAAAGATIGDVLAAALWLLLLTLLAFLSKENGALLPLLLVVAEVTLFRGMWAGRGLPLLTWCGRAVLVMPLVVLALLLLAFPEVLTGPYAGREFSLEERLLTQARAGWRYVSWLVLPNVMDMGFFHDDIALSSSIWSPATTALSLLAWLAVFAVALLGQRRYPLFCFAVLFFLAAHVMESTVLPLEMVFEHRNYLPSLGVCLFVAATVTRVAHRTDWFPRGMAAVVILAILFAQLLWRTQAWQDEESLARFNVINHPASPRANFFYGNALYKRFERADELGLSAEEKPMLAVAARGYFEQMHRLDERDLAAPVMLYQLDSRYFPGLVEKNDWLSVLETLLADRVLQRSDVSALNALARVAFSNPGDADADRIREIIDTLVRRYPWEVELLASQFRLTLALDNNDKSAMLAPLKRSLKYTDSAKVASYMAQYYGGSDIGKTYEAIALWLERDRPRREIHRIAEIFDRD